MEGAKKIFGWKRLMIYLVSLLLLIVIGAFIYVNHFMNKSLPQIEGSITLPIQNQVTVTTDENGVPHIKAETLEDLYKAQCILVYSVQSRFIC